MTVGVKIRDYGSADKKWGMTMYVTCENPSILYKFEIDEPYLYYLNEWRMMANGIEPIHLGGVSSDDGYYKFTVGVTDPSPEVYSQMFIKKEHLSDELTKAIDEAVRMGLKFQD